MTSATNVDRWLYDNSPYMNFFTLTVRNYTFFLYIYIVCDEKQINFNFKQCNRQIYIKNTIQENTKNTIVYIIYLYLDSRSLECSSFKISYELIKNKILKIFRIFKLQ